MMEKLNEKELSPATKKHYLSLVSKIFKHGVEEGVIKAIPLFPKISERLTTKEKRDFLTMGEYTKLNNTARDLAKNRWLIGEMDIKLNYSSLRGLLMN